MKYPVFNYKPLDDLADYLWAHGSEQAKQLLANSIGRKDCCWGNPCYYHACLACHCRGNIRYLTANQAYIRDGKTLSKEKIEFGDRRSLTTEDSISCNLCGGSGFYKKEVGRSLIPRRCPDCS